MAPPNVSGPPNPASSISTISTFGASSGAFGPATIVQSAIDSSSVRPMVPPKSRSGSGSRVRSGLNLSIASASDASRPFSVGASISTTDVIADPASACCTDSRLADGSTAITTPAPAASRGADCRRGQQRRCEQAHRYANAGAPAGALAAEVVARVDHGGVAFGILGSQYRTTKRDPLVFDALGQGIEVTAAKLEILVASYQDQCLLFTHQIPPLLRPRSNLKGATSMLTRCGLADEAHVPDSGWRTPFGHSESTMPLNGEIATP